MAHTASEGSRHPVDRTLEQQVADWHRLLAELETRVDALVERVDMLSPAPAESPATPCVGPYYPHPLSQQLERAMSSIRSLVAEFGPRYPNGVTRLEVCRRCGAAGFKESEFLSPVNGLCADCNREEKSEPRKFVSDGDGYLDTLCRLVFAAGARTSEAPAPTPNDVLEDIESTRAVLAEIVGRNDGSQPLLVLARAVRQYQQNLFAYVNERGVLLARVAELEANEAQAIAAATKLGESIERLMDRYAAVDDHTLALAAILARDAAQGLVKASDLARLKQGWRVTVERNKLGGMVAAVEKGGAE